MAYSAWMETVAGNQGQTAEAQAQAQQTTPASEQTTENQPAAGVDLNNPETNPLFQALNETTSVNTDPADHTVAEQAVIEEYKSAVATDLVAFANDALNAKGDNAKLMSYELGSVSERAAKDIQRILGVDSKGYRVVLKGDVVQHIENGHGPNGYTDHSLADLNDLGRINYVLQNYDTVEKGIRSKEFRNKKIKPLKP